MREPCFLLKYAISLINLKSQVSIYPVWIKQIQVAKIERHIFPEGTPTLIFLRLLHVLRSVIEIQEIDYRILLNVTHLE